MTPLCLSTTASNGTYSVVSHFVPLLADYTITAKLHIFKFTVNFQANQAYGKKPYLLHNNTKHYTVRMHILTTHHHLLPMDTNNRVWRKIKFFTICNVNKYKNESYSCRIPPSNICLTDGSSEKYLSESKTVTREVALANQVVHNILGGRGWCCLQNKHHQRLTTSQQEEWIQSVFKHVLGGYDWRYLQNKHHRPLTTWQQRRQVQLVFKHVLCGCAWHCLQNTHRWLTT